MQNARKIDMLRIKDGRIVCPVCKKRTHQAVTNQTTATNLPLWCEHCRQVHSIDIDVGQCCMISPCR